MTYTDIRTGLMQNADEGYAEFMQRGIPTDRPILGVRVPYLREIAASIPRTDFKTILTTEPISLEEVMLRGIIISRLNYAEMLDVFDSQIPYLGDWCTCDTFASGIKPLIKKHKQDFFDTKIDPLLTIPSSSEFAVRLGLVIMLGAYVEPDYLAVIYDRVESLKDREEYYIKMALSWLVAECFIKFPDETFGFLRVTKLPKWTYNKAISKICDSRRVDEDAKAILKTLRK
ncbi:DNA alkylation repair protein [Candidatus Saccharibacteria bacterium]|nr:DNA alkylation repair protein [Candidatus Saccharibacteria bacterium]